MGDAPGSRKGAPFVSDSEVSWVDSAPGVRRKVLCHDNGIMVVRFKFEAGAIGPEHSHPHVQCSVIESGVFDVTIDGRTKRLSAGDSYLVASNLVHGAVAVEAGVIVDAFAPMRLDLA